MSQRKTIIHIGLQKTASTYLQKVFFPSLKNVTYIGRPYTQENFAFNTLQYADDILYNPVSMQKEICKIENSFPDNDTLLISDELFSGYAFYGLMNRSVIASRLKQAFPGAEIVLFFRNQEELILSLYNQYIKSAHIDSYLDESFLYLPGKGMELGGWNNDKHKWTKQNRYIHQHGVFCTEHFRYTNIYEFYNRLFDKVHVFLYEDFKNNQIGVLQCLADILSSEVPEKFFEAKKEGKNNIINKRQNTHQLHSKLMQNRFNHLSPFAKSKFGKMIASSLSLFMQDQEKENIEYVRSMLSAADLYKDNMTLNSIANLGMERYSDLYFENKLL